MHLLTEHGPALLFYLFAACALAGALGVVTQRNPMYGALCLLGTFLSVAALFLLRHAELVGIVQIFVYGGGIMVLFLFVIMLVNLQALKEERRTVKQFPAVLVLALLLAALLGGFLWRAALGPAFTQPEAFTTLPPEAGQPGAEGASASIGSISSEGASGAPASRGSTASGGTTSSPAQGPGAVAPSSPGNSESVSWLLFSAHLLPFEIASLFLLIAMIGAVVLGRRRLGPPGAGGPVQGGEPQP